MLVDECIIKQLGCKLKDTEMKKKKVRKAGIV